MSAADIERTFTSNGLESKAARVAREALSLRAAEDSPIGEGTGRQKVIRFEDGTSFRVTDEYKTMVSQLEEDDEALRLEAMDYLMVLNPKIIAQHTPAIIPKLKGCSPSETCRALDVLEKLEVGELPSHAVAGQAAFS